MVASAHECVCVYVCVCVVRMEIDVAVSAHVCACVVCVCVCGRRILDTNVVCEFPVCCSCERTESAVEAHQIQIQNFI